MATTTSIQRKNTSKKSGELSLRNLSSLSIGGFGALEIAVLGAAIYVVYRNWDKVEQLLTKAGVDVGSLDVANLIPEQYRDFAKAGTTLLSRKFNSGESGSRGQTGNRRPKFNETASAKDFQ